MVRLAVILFIMIGTALSGIAVTAVLATPALALKAAMWIPVAVAIGCLIALPVSVFVARGILSVEQKR